MVSGQSGSMLENVVLHVEMAQKNKNKDERATILRQRLEETFVRRTPKETPHETQIVKIYRNVRVNILS